ncbi:MAG TPA: MBL fold metallo-hydrolase, partial [Mycobacterium sp.]|nr:MBL fold metallo-hydrolase [Mycobacterium sp.]
MSGIDLVPLVDEGLGNSAYLIDLGDKRGLVVDVSRDLRAVHVAAARRGLTVAFAADTHLHADFLSGAHQLAATVGAKVLASAAGHREFAHTGLHDGDEVDLGGLRLRALLTPGHTHEHLSFLLLDGDREVGVFTGGSLIVGSAARTDLVSDERTEELARLQYASLRRLATLPGEVQVWPTHGAGSFCSAPPGAERTSTIAHELATNPLLQAADENSFVAALLGSLGSYPPYFQRLGEINRIGPPVLEDDPVLLPMSASAVSASVADGSMLIDARPVDRFARAHVRGAISIPLRPVFASWLGWLV